MHHNSYRIAISVQITTIRYFVIIVQPCLKGFFYSDVFVTSFQVCAGLPLPSFPITSVTHISKARHHHTRLPHLTVNELPANVCNEMGSMGKYEGKCCIFRSAHVFYLKGKTVICFIPVQTLRNPGCSLHRCYHLKMKVHPSFTHIFTDKHIKNHIASKIIMYK